MESSLSITKEFECRKHPGEKIQRVSSTDGSIVLYCIDCVLAIEDEQTKETVLPIKDFIQCTAAYFEKLPQQGQFLQGAILRPCKLLPLSLSQPLLKLSRNN